MATRTPAQTTPATTPAEPTLNDLIAQKRALEEQLRAVNAAMPKLSPLDKVIAAQTAQPSKWIPLHLSNRVKARVRAGQPRQEAIDGVLAQFRTLLETEPETTPTND